GHLLPEHARRCAARYLYGRHHEVRPCSKTRTIEVKRVTTCLTHPVGEHAHLPPQHVVDRNTHLSRIGQIQFQRRSARERVRVSRPEGKLTRRHAGLVPERFVPCHYEAGGAITPARLTDRKADQPG